ncbi:hypothetical protein [Bacillus sp. S/N-304-OC-R1]|nr:hypothetical protein [Bacillus sp. S/N-304-OC-R1]MBY0122039.1 hypothetical protein [Bacillus sp. S/N-304-OC-R1]
MKEKQRDSGTMDEAVSDEQELIREFAKPDTKQPMPQPKDFEEIEY